MLGLDTNEQISHQNPARDKRERDRHVKHRMLARDIARLAKDWKPITYRLYPGIGAGSHAIGTKEDYPQADRTQGFESVAGLVHCIAEDARQLKRPADDRINHQSTMHKDRG